MGRNVEKHWLVTSHVVVDPPMPRRWKWFIAASTGLVLALAGAIALWLPQHQAIAWALAMFGSCHAAFLLVQPLGQEPIEGAGRRASGMFSDQPESS